MAITSNIRVAGPVLEKKPVRPTALELPAISEIARFMLRTEQEEPVLLTLLGPHDERIALPESLCRILREAVVRLGRGESVSILGADEELTTQQAADALNVSRPYIVALLEQGKIPHRMVGTHRRVRVADLLEFKKGDDRKEEDDVEYGPTVGCNDRRHDVRSEPDVDSVLREERRLDDAEPYYEVDEDGNSKGDSAEEDGEEDHEIEIREVYGETGLGGDEELGEGDYEELRQDKVPKG